MAQTAGWRSFWWLNAGLNGFAFLVVLVAFPETSWHRVHPNESGSHGPNVQSTEVQQRREPIDLQPEKIEDRPVADLRASVGMGIPGRSQYHLWQSHPSAIRSLLTVFCLPWRLFLYPIVLLAGLIVAFSSTSYLLITLVQAQAFGQPPYEFGSQSIGFLNFASLVGALLSLVSAGPAADWISMYFTRRNSGIREPEMRLPTMLAYIPIMLLGNFVMAFGLQQHWDWQVCLSRLIKPQH